MHRDLKPANILVSSAGEVKLVDFGIATWLAEVGGERRHPDRVPVAHPRLRQPEQVRGERLTTATDVYSLGAVLYELLGTAPVPSRGPALVARARNLRAGGRTPELRLALIF